MSYNNLLRCADSVAAYSFGIHNTTHHVSFVLRTTQSSFATNVRIATSTNHSNCIQALGCKTSNKYATLSHTNWLIGFVVKSAPPVTFHILRFPLMQSQAFKHTFFPLHQLCCYNHRSYQWSLPHRSEQACLNELLLAELCRHTSFGLITQLILHSALGEPYAS
jgi:hypothetical protein